MPILVFLRNANTIACVKRASQPLANPISGRPSRLRKNSIRFDRSCWQPPFPSMRKLGTMRAKGGPRPRKFVIRYVRRVAQNGSFMSCGVAIPLASGIGCDLSRNVRLIALSPNSTTLLWGHWRARLAAECCSELRHIPNHPIYSNFLRRVGIGLNLQPDLLGTRLPTPVLRK